VALTKRFGSIAEKVMEESYNAKLHNLWSSPRTIRVIRSRRMRWVRHVVRTKMRNTLHFMWKRWR